MVSTLIATALLASLSNADRVVFEGHDGPGKGKHVVFLAGDEEYRSEEALTQLARILSVQFGFHCTVLFSIGQDGAIDPNRHDNQPGMETLDKADLVVMLLRFRSWPDDQMKHFVDYFGSGKPILALRTSTHAFSYPPDSQSPFRSYSWNSKEWLGGFGKQVLGETWISHWGNHKVQATRGVVTEIGGKSPILRGVEDVFCTTDVYEAHPPADCKILMTGQVLEGMNSTDPPASGRKPTVDGIEQSVNNPMMPILWERQVRGPLGRTSRIVTTTMGSATDIVNDGIRRMLINSVFSLTGLERKISQIVHFELSADYMPSAFGFDGFRKGVRPEELQH